MTPSRTGPDAAKRKREALEKALTLFDLALFAEVLTDSAPLQRQAMTARDEAVAKAREAILRAYGRVCVQEAKEQTRG